MKREESPFICCETHAHPSARQAYIAILTSNSILIFPLALTKWTIPHRLHTSIPIPIPTPHAQQHPDETKPEIELVPSPPCLHITVQPSRALFSSATVGFFSNSKIMPKGDNGRSDDMREGAGRSKTPDIKYDWDSFIISVYMYVVGGHDWYILFYLKSTGTKTTNQPFFFFTHFVRQNRHQRRGKLSPTSLSFIPPPPPPKTSSPASFFQLWIKLWMGWEKSSKLGD